MLGDGDDRPAWPVASYLGIRRARSMRFAAATANLAQAIWDTYLQKGDVSNGSVTDGHEFDWATPDVRSPFRSWPLAFAPILNSAFSLGLSVLRFP